MRRNPTILLLLTILAVILAACGPEGSKPGNPEAQQYSLAQVMEMFEKTCVIYNLDVEEKIDPYETELPSKTRCAEVIYTNTDESSGEKSKRTKIFIHRDGVTTDDGVKIRPEIPGAANFCGSDEVKVTGDHPNVMLRWVLQDQELGTAGTNQAVGAYCVKGPGKER